jgi:hypothetical protein
VRHTTIARRMVKQHTATVNRSQSAYKAFVHGHPQSRVSMSKACSQGKHSSCFSLGCSHSFHKTGN